MSDVIHRYDPTAFREVFEHHFTYVAGVDRNSHRFASRPALHDPASGRRWTYAELWADVGRLAAGLADAGVGPGDVVVFQLYNCPEFALLWLAAQRLGAVASPINFRLSSGETAYVLDDSRPRAFVYDAALATLASDALARAEHRPSLLAVVGESSFDDLLRGERPGARASRGRDDLRRDHAAVHVRHDGPAQGRVPQRGRRGALRPRRDHALPAVARGPDAEHDALVPPRRAVLRRAQPGLLRRRRGGAAARVRPRRRPRLGPGARADLPHRRADEPRPAQRRAAGAPARPVEPARHRHDGRAAGSRVVPALPGAAHRPHLQRLRDHRGVLEHVPAPGGPPRPRGLGRACVHGRRRRRRARLRGPHRRLRTTTWRRTARRSARWSCGR